jgi:peptide/nickel transport system permease protein
VFSRTIFGARRSLAVAAVATVVGLTVGGALGLVAGYYRRRLDGAIAAVLNILLAVPGLVLALALVAFFAPPGSATPTQQTAWATAALSILAVPTIARVARAQTMAWADRDFVLASRTLGTRNLRIMTREVLPNILPAMFSFAFLGLAVLIIVEAALAFFGVGDVSGVSWGIMIQNGRAQLDRAPHMVLFPSLFMFLTILALNVVGDQMRSRFDVRESGI